MTAGSKRLIVRISQSGENNPTWDILYNSYGVSFTIVRQGQGAYQITADDVAFDGVTPAVNHLLNPVADSSILVSTTIADQEFNFTTLDALGGAATDGLLLGDYRAVITIVTYPEFV